MNAKAPALVFTGVTLIVVLFQLALAAGAPWGEAAMGGKFPGTLPTAMRVAAVVQMVVLLLLAATVLARAGLFWPRSFNASLKGIWFVVAFTAVGTLMNLITRSKWERRIWAPAVAVMLACSMAVALSPRARAQALLP